MPTSDAYTQCLDAMYSMRRFGIVLGLATITNILDGLGNPQHSFSAIHIAGTNGKGSIASALATILHNGGYRVGLYTSPHLIRFNERICIDGEPIPDHDVVASWEAVRSVHHGDREPTFFEFSTAMAFYEFGRHQVDFAVIEKTAARRSAPLYMKGREFNVRRTGSDRFTYNGIDHRWPGMRTGLIGGHQVDNAALTLAASELIMRRHARISKSHIQEGLVNHRWPGRLEVVSQKPYVILDGAHNLAAARRLRRFLQDALSRRRITMVAGILDDKPFAAILKDLLKPCQRLIITQAKIDRSLPPKTLEAVAKPLIDDIEIVPDVGEAVRHAIATSGPDDAVCIAGSLYVVGEAKAALDNASGEIFRV